MFSILSNRRNWLAAKTQKRSRIVDKRIVTEHEKYIKIMGTFIDDGTINNIV